MQEAGANGTQKLTKADISTSIFQKMMAELGGTYIVIFIGCGAALVNKVQPLTVVGIAIVWGLVFMATVYAVGHVSGAHFNPAVTIALAAGRRFPVKHREPVFGQLPISHKHDSNPFNHDDITLDSAGL